MAGPPEQLAPQVIIVLSSFNGARFLGEQIDSIRRQSYPSWTLLVRDDGSSDGSMAVAERFARLDPRIQPLQDGRGNLGPAASFGALLERAGEIGAPYIALADQDDVWQPTKLARELALLRQREAQVGRTTPLLVHSDLTVVAEDLRVIHDSFLQYQRLGHAANSPASILLVQNTVTGCTAVLNRALLQAALPLSRVVMHDWWLALCAAVLGEICLLPEATVLYRQHAGNAIGSPGWREAGRRVLRAPVRWWRQSNERFAAAVYQARELWNRVEPTAAGPLPAGRALVALQEFSLAFSGGAGPLGRLRTVRRHAIRPSALLRYPVFFYLRVLLWRGSSAASERSVAPAWPDGESGALGRGLAIHTSKDGLA